MPLPVRLNLDEFSKLLYTDKEIKQLFGKDTTIDSFNKDDHMVERNGSYLFRPVSDTRDTILEQKYIASEKNWLGHYAMALKSLDKPIIFPLLERGSMGGKPREHFAVLHYDPKTKTATLIESVASIVSRAYSLDPLREALRHAGLGDVKLKVVYQNIQYEDGLCGHIAAQNCRALYNQTDPRKLENYLTKYDLPHIKQFNDNLIDQDAKTKLNPPKYDAVQVNFFQRHWGKFTALNVFLSMTAVMLLSAGIIYATGGLAAIPLLGVAVASKLGIGIAGSMAAGAVLGGTFGVVSTIVMGAGEYISRKWQAWKSKAKQVPPSQKSHVPNDISNGSFVDVTSDFVMKESKLKEYTQEQCIEVRSEAIVVTSYNKISENLVDNEQSPPRKQQELCSDGVEEVALANNSTSEPIISSTHFSNPCSSLGSTYSEWTERRPYPQVHAGVPKLNIPQDESLPQFRK